MSEQLTAMFMEEACACGARVFRVSREETATVIAGLVKQDGLTVVASSAEDIGRELQAEGVEAVMERPGESLAGVLSQAGAGVGTSFAGIAASGSVLIGPGSGAENLISILPPHFVVLLEASNIEPDLTTALAAAAPSMGQPGARFTLVTGPSRTSDIELTPVIGVHGPVRLDVVIVNA
jgi:L-lactate utilization protein LutC